MSIVCRWEQLLEDSKTRKERLQHAQDQYKKVNTIGFFLGGGGGVKFVLQFINLFINSFFQITMQSKLVYNSLSTFVESPLRSGNRSNNFHHLYLI